MAEKKENNIEELNERNKRLKSRIERARQDRNHVQTSINKFYELALPWRQPVSTNPTDALHPRPLEKQSDIFDDTFQHSVRDCAAMMNDLFTPHYRPWASLKPGRRLSDNETAKIAPALEAREKAIYDAIRSSDFYEQVQQPYLELGGSKGGIIIPYAASGKPIHCTPIVMSALLDDVGPTGLLDMRAMEFQTTKRNVLKLWPELKKKLLSDEKFKAKSEMAPCTAVQGCHMNDTGSGWIYFIVIDGEVLQFKNLSGTEAAPVHVLRWEDSPYSSWGPGFAIPGLPAGRVLQEIGFLFLKNLGKLIDAPFAYTEDGLFNPEGGIEAGMALPMERGTEFEWLIPDRDVNAALFERDQLRLTVKRSMFQDKPEQRGETPPTATQWIDERAQTDRRMQLNRYRIYKEWVLPILRRFNWILEKRGDLEPIKIGGDLIEVSFENPIAKTSDAEEVSRSMQLAQSMAGIFGEQFLANADGFETMEKWKEKMGDKLLALKPFDQQSEGLQGLLGNMRNLTNQA
jgi:hypothetical protein